MDWKATWLGMGRGARWGLGGGMVVIFLATCALGYWALHTDYDVLFSRLSTQDAAAMTKELDQMKVPYRIGDDGTSILAERASVPQLRLRLMGKDLPLHGAVGFELFNNSDFGMTEFAQRVNYQRALQGELTRTIQSLAEVESVRVHLAFPEEGLFKREQGHAKASVALTLRDGRELRRDQVRGIQRLVAAAVPGIESRDVTLVNAQGVALTIEAGGAEGSETASSLRMELKRETELYLSQKANAILAKAFGPGAALASVDVELDMNQVKITREDVVTPPAADGEAPSGIVVHEREVTKDAPRSPGSNSVDGSELPSSTQHEIDYQLGRRVEQVVSSPGAITHLQALAVLRVPVGPAQAEQVRQLLASAVGASQDRRDVVVVQSVEGLAAGLSGQRSDAAGAMPGDGVASDRLPKTVTGQTARHAESASVWSTAQIIALCVGLVLVAAVAFAIGRSKQGAQGASMDARQREASLAAIKSWLAQKDGSASSGTIR